MRQNKNDNLRKSLMFYVPSIKEMIKDMPISIDKLPAFNPKRVLRRRITRSLTKRNINEYDEYTKDIKEICSSYGRFTHLPHSIFDYKMRSKYQERLDDILGMKQIDPSSPCWSKALSEVPKNFEEARSHFKERKRVIMLERIRKFY